MKIFEHHWTKKVPREQWPQPGEIYICLDPQQQLGPETWLVSCMGDGTLKGDTVQLGLFWKKELAVEFAKDIELTRKTFEFIRQYGFVVDRGGRVRKISIED